MIVSPQLWLLNFHFRYAEKVSVTADLSSESLKTAKVVKSLNPSHF